MEILDGNLVRWIGGRDKPRVLSEDPLQAAKEWTSWGANRLHVVDLDAMFGTGDNNDVLRQLNAAGVQFQVRGGVRTEQRARRLLKLGAQRVVLGDLSFRDWSAARKLVLGLGLRVVATLDVCGEKVLVHGETVTALDLDKAIVNLLDSGVEHVIYNNVSRTGEDAAPDLDVLAHVMSHGSFQVHARCTMHSIDEMSRLLELQRHGLRGIILNHALDPDSVPMAQLLECASQELLV